MTRFKANQTYRRIGIAILLNILIFLCALLIFEPTTKSDDYNIINILYGGIDGHYSEFLLYTNVVFGKILVCLMKIAPNISWYFVLQYLLMICANIVIVSILLKKERLGCFYSIIYLIFFAYEFYIRITFSKTAGFLIAAGYFLILNLLESETTKLLIIPSIICFFFGILIRSAFFELITTIMFSVFLIHIIINGLQNQKLIISYILIVLLLWGGDKALVTYSNYTYNHDTEWQHFREDNAYRSHLVDYGIPSYDRYQKQYEQLGVSRNDYTLWFTYAMLGDNDILTNDLYKAITDIDEGESDDHIGKIINSLKNLLRYWTSNTAFYFFVFSAILFMLLNPPALYYMVGVILSACIASYVYMSVMGRTQHHVDVVVYLLASLLVFHYIEPNGKMPKKKVIAILTMLIGFTLIHDFYAEINSSSYYGTELTGRVASQKNLYEENYKMYKYMSLDADHLYVIPAQETNLTFSCFTVFNVIPKGFYHNIYRINMNHIPTHLSILRKYEVENIWRDSVNSDVIRFAVSKQLSYQMDSIITYINEHYATHAEYELADSIGTMNIYRIHTK